MDCFACGFERASERVAVLDGDIPMIFGHSLFEQLLVICMCLGCEQWDGPLRVRRSLGLVSLVDSRSTVDNVFNSFSGGASLMMVFDYVV